MKLEDLKKKIEEIEITYDYDSVYCDLRNTTIDYMNETQDWDFDYLFEDYVDEDILREMVSYKIKDEGLWSVQNLLNDIKNYEGYYKIDVYGYGHDVDIDDLKDLKQEILDKIDKKMEENENDNI